MKKLFLFLTMVCLSLPIWAGAGTSKLDAIDFDWTNGNEQQAGESLWYKVDLTGVATGENVILYLSNLTSEDASVTAQAFLLNGDALNDATTKLIAPKRNAAMELSGSLVQNLSSKVIYIYLSTDKKIKFAAEAVEPGEKDLDCLSATAFNWAGTMHAVGTNWYKIDLAKVMADATKTVEITIINQGSATATVVGGLSTDCPSTGTMERTLTVNAGAKNVYTLKRSQLNMLGTDMIYIRLESNQKLLLTAQEVVAVSDDDVVVENAVDFALNQTYSLGANAAQWYKVNVADLAKLEKVLEVTIENKGAKTANIDAHLQYAVISSDYMTRNITLAAGQTTVKEIARNLIETVAGKTSVAYVKLATTQPIAFSVSVKGSACLEAKSFDWAGTAHAASTEPTWYAIDIKEAKTKANSDIQLTVKNNGSAVATIATQIAFDCPCDATTDMTRTVAAGSAISKVLKNSMYSNLATDTIWVALTANQNVVISAEYVAAEAFTPIDACKEAVALKVGTAYNVAAEGWFAVTLSDVTVANKVPEVKVTNAGANVANVTIEVAFACPVTQTMQSRTIAVAAGQEYVKAITDDMLQSLDPSIKTAYVRVTTSQPITFVANLIATESDTDSACATAKDFVWAGTTHEVGTAWYKVDLAKVIADEKKTVEVTIVNQGSAAATVVGGLSTDCPSTGTMNRTITLNAGAQSVYTLKRSQINMLGAEQLYISLESNQKLLISAREIAAETNEVTVENAIDFALNTTYALAANATQWYKVNIADLDKARQLLEVTIENKAAATASIDALLQYQLTSSDYMTRNLALGAGKVYVKDITRNLIETVHKNTEVAYIRLTTTEDITFVVRLKERLEGTACLKAKDFVWDGTYQAGGENATWYAINIKEVKADSKHNLELTVENRGAGEATLQAQVAFDCPCEVTTDATRTVATGATVSKVVNYSAYANLATDTIWVALTTNQDVMLSLKKVEAEPFTPITACDKAEAFKLDTLYKQVVGEGWYTFNISEMLIEPNKAPELTVTNTGATTATIKVEVAFACPVTSAMQSRTITVPAGAEYVKMTTIDMLNSIDPSIETAYVRVTTDQPITFIGTLKFENEGGSCATATVFDWVNGNAQEAETTVWYAVDITEAKKATGKSVQLTVENLSSAVADLNVELSMDCPSTGVTTYKSTIAAGATANKVFTNSVINSVAADVVYIRLTSTQQIHISAQFVDEEAADEAGCAKAIAFDWINGHNQKAETGVWYKVAMDKLTAHEVPHLYLDNLAATATSVTAELTFDCAAATTSKTIQLGANQSVDKLLDETLIEGLDADTAYIRVFTTGDIHFYVDLQDPNQGQDCAHAIPFDWVNGNFHMAGDSLWYVVELKDTMKVETRDLQIMVKNLASTEALAIVDIKTDCAEEPLLEGYKAELAANDSASRKISNGILQGYDYIRVCLSTNADVHLTAKFVDATVKQYYDTVQVYGEVCLGGDYIYNNGKDTVLIADGDRASWTWTDTVAFKVSEIEMADSIITYSIIPIQTPDTFFTEFAAPVVVEGKAIDVQAATADLLAKYEAERNKVAEPYRDTVAVVKEVQWEMQGATSKWEAIPTTPVAFGTIDVALRYVIITDICEDEQVSEPIYVDVQKGLYLEHDTIRDTVCVNTKYAFKTQELTIDADVVVNDTVFLPNYAADQQAQDVYVYDIRVWKELVLPTGLEANVIAKENAVLDITGAEAALKANLDAQIAADPLVSAYTDVKWEMLNATGTEYGVVLNTPITKDYAYISLRYTVTTECKTYVDTLADIIPHSAVDKYIDTILCAGSEFVTQLGDTIVINQDTTFSEIKAISDVVDWKYNYTIKVYKPITLPSEISELPVAICGEPLDVKAATVALKATLDALVQEDNSTIEAILWLIKYNGKYVNAAEFEAIPAASDEDLTVCYAVLTSCEDVLVSNDILLTVEEPTSDNTANYLPAANKYDGWLLMLHKNDCETLLGVELLPEYVSWYKVGNTDELVGTGFYYTTGEQLVGEYYAIVELPVSEANLCGGVYRTQTLTCAATATISLAPSVVAPGEDVVISGLNPTETYNVDIYNLTGVLVERIEISGTTTYTLKAQAQMGYYMVNVQDDTTLKYIVK